MDVVAAQRQPALLIYKQNLGAVLILFSVEELAGGGCSLVRLMAEA